MAWLRRQAQGIPDGTPEEIYFSMPESAYVGMLLEVDRDNDVHVLRILKESEPREA